MKEKLKKVLNIVVFIYGLAAIVVAIIYLLCVGMGSDVHANAVRGMCWLGFGGLIVYSYVYTYVYPEKNSKRRVIFNQWVEYDKSSDFLTGKNGTTYNYSGCVILTDDSLTISYQDKFGIKTSTYARLYGPDRNYYVGLDDIWIEPFLDEHVIIMNNKIIRLNYNRALITNQK